MDKQSSEIIENFIQFLRSKKDVISKYSDKYKEDSDEVTMKRYEFDDIISELNDSISQSIQAIKSLQMENENLKETINTFQLLQHSSHLKQSAFSFEDKQDKQEHFNHNYYEDNIDNERDLYENSEDDRNYERRPEIRGRENPSNVEARLRITNESEMTIGNKVKKGFMNKDLVEEEEEILPYTPYEPIKNNAILTSKNNNYIERNETIDTKINSMYNEKGYMIENKMTSQLSNSPRFSKNVQRLKDQATVDKKNELKENMLIVDSYSINKKEEDNIIINKKAKEPTNISHKSEDEELPYQEQFYKNNENNSSYKISPLKVGIRQKLKNFANNALSHNSSRIKSENQSICNNPNSRSQTLNISNIYNNNPDKAGNKCINQEYEFNTMNQNNTNINQDDREILLNEIIKKLNAKENFKSYFTLKYSEGSFIELQNKLITSETFLYEIGRELFDIENQISEYQVVPEESKYSMNYSNNTSSSIKNRNIVNKSKKEEFSKTSHNFPSKERITLRANSNKHSNLKRINPQPKSNDNNYLEPINFEKLLRNQRKQPIEIKKKPFNRFNKQGNASTDKRKSNASSDYINKSREFYDN